MRLIVGAQLKPGGVLGDLAADQDVLQMVEARVLPEGVDGRETARRGRLRPRGSRGHQQKEEDSKSEPGHPSILASAFPSGRR